MIKCWTIKHKVYKLQHSWHTMYYDGNIIRHYNGQL
uniref:Uncharacterized protein n=1 Tax=Ciona intestinalis TaxID=7719 RepID=H2XWM0_CIOIN